VKFEGLETNQNNIIYVFHEDVFAPGGLVNSGRMPAQIFLLSVSKCFNDLS
jgi:hypothetical protein